MAKNTRKAAEYFLKGTEAIKIESFGVAKAMLSKAHALDRDNPDIMIRLAQVYLTIGMGNEAMEVLKRCVKRKPNYPDALLLLSQAHMELRQIDEMHRALDKALAWDPTHGACLHAKVTGYINSGEHELAGELIDRLGKVDDPHPLYFMSKARVARAKKDFAGGIDAANNVLEHPRALDRHKRSARFELGHLHDAIGDYDKAFEYFKLANAGHIQGKTIHAETMISMWSPEMLASIPQSSIDTGRPVFIAGMPRSGTTLTERILVAHPLVEGVGECPLIGQMINRKSPTSLSGEDIDSYAQEYVDLIDSRVMSETTRVIDKHMGAERTLGLISRLFPSAKIIHCLRDPIDSCLSSYFQNFGTNVSYSRDQIQMAKQYVAHRRVMEHWYEVLDLEIMQSSYEELVAEPEDRSRDLVAHIGLDFDERCLRFHESREHVGTASGAQVRNPIYKTSRQRWRNYEKHIGPLIEHLGEYAQTDKPPASTIEHGA
jgi:tetratricopeptide (TPR) repeat protein